MSTSILGTWNVWWTWILTKIMVWQKRSFQLWRFYVFVLLSGCKSYCRPPKHIWHNFWELFWVEGRYTISIPWGSLWPKYVYLSSDMLRNTAQVCFFSYQAFLYIVFSLKKIYIYIYTQKNALVYKTNILFMYVMCIDVHWCTLMYVCVNLCQSKSAPCSTHSMSLQLDIALRSRTALAV